MEEVAFLDSWQVESTPEEIAAEDTVIVISKKASAETLRAVRIQGHLDAAETFGNYLNYVKIGSTTLAL
eukprot:2997287-Amphidinium_carterae.1